ncbi:MAG: HTTM domain-containing protein [Raineya sp.]|jgi:hypothetical protein|nr:HTTM domain-containing protein [Raineya sp.]
MFERWTQKLSKPTSIAPLLVFRLFFGAMMVFGTLRFMWLGWIEDHYIEPIFHFKYWGFEWVEPLSKTGLYIVHILMILGALGVMFAGKMLYRISAITLFITFTYTELIDLTYYLNHYYFVSCICLLLAILPYQATQNLKNFKTGIVPQWVILIFKLQIAFVYVYAGLAKINYDWLILALPLKIWLPAHSSIPIIGEIFTWKITPYLFSWFGMLYDCLIVFFLAYRKTGVMAYITVIIFHSLTGLLFQIGIFPLVMMGGTLIFFDWSKWTQKQNLQPTTNISHLAFYKIFLGVYFLFQTLFPWRFLLYDGKLFWTEQGYRFGWRVMLMEKAGTATFYIKNTQTGKETIVDNQVFLNAHQEKQMAMQPDMILQFAHFLGKYYEKKGFGKPEVRVEAYVTLNARPSALLINPKTDLMKEKDTFKPKKWIMPYPY